MLTGGAPTIAVDLEALQRRRRARLVGVVAPFVILLVMRFASKPACLSLPTTRNRLATRPSRGPTFSEEAALIQEGLHRLLPGPHFLLSSTLPPAVVAAWLPAVVAV